MSTSGVSCVWINHVLLHLHGFVFRAVIVAVVRPCNTCQPSGFVCSSCMRWLYLCPARWRRHGRVSGSVQGQLFVSLAYIMAVYTCGAAGAKDRPCRLPWRRECTRSTGLSESRTAPGATPGQRGDGGPSGGDASGRRPARQDGSPAGRRADRPSKESRGTVPKREKHWPGYGSISGRQFGFADQPASRQSALLTLDKTVAVTLRQRRRR